MTPLIAVPEASAGIVDWASQATKVTIEARQGYDFYSAGGTGRCTIAYNDHVSRTSLTAAHCGVFGEDVFLKDSSGRKVKAGTLEPSLSFDRDATSNDWAVIKWDPSVNLGDNSFSGDAIVPLEDLVMGDTLCVRGSSSHGTTDKVSCAPYVGNVNNSVFFENTAGKPGDSGGTVFVPGKGFVGIYSGATEFYDAEGTRRKIERASLPSDGPDITMRQLNHFLDVYLEGAFRISATEMRVVPLGSVVEAATTASDEVNSPTVGRGGIVGIVVAVLAIVLMAAGGAMFMAAAR
ncbi:trypsin-like serine protease [Corynebacterium aquatimens]|uniref:Peptidase S1 domain-containing protein n=1 Tax=Corynebacterium aquatimens TaxID=1190508 RepID=A0A931GXE1_9CORY|nr:trypsin-like serine protease [Corynebacterium aquatimens]MBG6121334.1 hypothetical protein [Corynebacterium aquatimens]